MRRVSSRQRLVSWDAFDATAVSDSGSGNDSSVGGFEEDDRSCASGYETAYSRSYHSSMALNMLCEGNLYISNSIDNTNSMEEITGIDATTELRRRKRDRKSSRSSPTERANSSKMVETPKTFVFTTLSTSKSPKLVPSHSWETGKPPPPSSVGFDDMISDLHLKIFSFLDLSSLRSAMYSSRHYRNLIISNDARNSLWMDHCEKIWHISEFMEESGQNQYHFQPHPKFTDNFHLPIAAHTSTVTNSTGFETDPVDTTNISLLLSLTPKDFPTCVDKDALKSRMQLSGTIRQTIPVDRQDDEDQQVQYYKEQSTGRSLIRYTGYVGQGDRCIRSNRPIPRPSQRARLNETFESAKDINEINSSRSLMNSIGPSFLHIDDSHHPLLYSLLQKCSSKAMKGDGMKSSKSSSSSNSSVLSPPSPSLAWTPFVVPFVDKSSSDDNSTFLNVTPRFISYYEVSILKQDGGENQADFPAERMVPPPLHRRSNMDCVAVGLGTKDFNNRTRMPGWDRQSFGYHGDDGGIFHASGGMLKQYGPKFGPGDTVGCGVDYISKGIFFTYNGKFLGYAWNNVSDDILNNDLYPVVGLDTNFAVHLNWGTSGPFEFDLSKFIKKHEVAVMATYSLDGCSCLCPRDTTVTGATAAETDSSTKKVARSFSGRSTSRRHRKGFIGKRNQSR
ncbi:unnamed protein product [Pseudo-nitzschia multistriata]|uniref:B30.2/SPRY domain-containing protein n=1 Tax=Pseudo-nitzschia multistriata TaxID=183589 RepID=A0A448ZH38_9STRA|nr:unnamed protein product [Pseudo-nitzschia multistriata]